MKKYIALSVILLASKLSAATVLVSDFGTDFSPVSGDWGSQFTQSGSNAAGAASFVSLVSPSNNSGDFLQLLPGPIDVTGTTQISLSLQLLAGNSASAANAVTVALYSSPTDTATATFTLNSFNATGFTTVTQLYTINGSFDPASVIGFGVSGGDPSGALAVRVSFDSISASSPVVVPEPSTYASLAGVAVLGFVAYRRRRQAV
jgi:hypothetical protein